MYTIWLQFVYTLIKNCSEGINIEKNSEELQTISKKCKDFLEKIDWNYNTVLSTVQKFDILRPKHPELKMKDFWQALLRGGIQGAVYFSDSTK